MSFKAILCAAMLMGLAACTKCSGGGEHTEQAPAEATAPAPEAAPADAAAPAEGMPAEQAPAEEPGSGD